MCNEATLQSINDRLSMLTDNVAMLLTRMEAVEGTAFENGVRVIHNRQDAQFLAAHLKTLIGHIRIMQLEHGWSEDNLIKDTIVINRDVK